MEHKSYMIFREGKGIGLTKEEAWQIYKEVQHNLWLTDAENQLRDYMRIEEECDRGFCVTADELCNPESEHYILDIAVERFEGKRDCDCAENDMWEAIYNDLLEGYEL